MNLDLQRSKYIKAEVTVHKCEETVQGRKLFKGGNYMRKYGKSFKYNLIIHGLTECYLLQENIQKETKKE